MNKAHIVNDHRAALRVPGIRLFIGAIGSFTLASRALAVVIAFQIYQITNSPLALGWLGLIEAIPAISLAPFGGYIADHFNRRRILLTTRAILVVCTLAMAWVSYAKSANTLLVLYGSIFLAGIARGLAEPANTAFEAQVVPRELTVNAASWTGMTWIVCSVAGPGSIGFIFDAWGAFGSYIIIALFFICSWFFTKAIQPCAQIFPENKEPVLKSIAAGWRFIGNNQPLLAAMSLDLFAVFFGGAIILLPVYAKDILHTGAAGLGLLNAAPSLGAAVITFWATHHPPIQKAGKNLLVCVAGFGIATIIFAFSRNFILSMAALFLTGIFDGVSMVIRRSMIRLLSPDAMRGRIASTNSIFVIASNELGAFEGAMSAALIGTVPCVAFGGVATLAIVALVTWRAPKLRNLSLS